MTRWYPAWRTCGPSSRRSFTCPSTTRCNYSSFRPGGAAVTTIHAVCRLSENLGLGCLLARAKPPSARRRRKLCHPLLLGDALSSEFKSLCSPFAAPGRHLKVVSPVYRVAPFIAFRAIKSVTSTRREDNRSCGRPLSHGVQLVTATLESQLPTATSHYNFLKRTPTLARYVFGSATQLQSPHLPGTPSHDAYDTSCRATT